MAASSTCAQWYRMSPSLGSENFSGSASTRASRHSFGNAKPITVPSRENARYTMRPIRNFTRPRTMASALRGSVLANARTSSILTTGSQSSIGAGLGRLPATQRGQAKRLTPFECLPTLLCPRAAVRPWWWSARKAGSRPEPGVRAQSGAVELSVNEGLHPVLQPRLDLGRLCLRDTSAGDGLVDLLVLGGDQRCHEPRDGLALVLGELAQRLGFERVTQFVLVHPEVCGRSAEEVRVLPESASPEITATKPEAATVEPGAEEERVLARIDLRLQPLRLLLGQGACVDRVVDSILQRLLQRIGKLLGLDAELGRRVVDDRLALVVRREDPGGSERAGRTESRDEQNSGTCGRGIRELSAARHRAHRITPA